MTHKTINWFGLKVSFISWWETLNIYKNVFIQKEYCFKAGQSNPLILDCGAHIGLSVLYFKKTYPEAKIVAFEPNPQAFKLLELNVRQNHLKNVKLINAALSNRVGISKLYIDAKSASHSWGDSLIEKWVRKKSGRSLAVKTVKLSDYIKENVDFLKMDVEGSESMVLHEIKDKLPFVKEIVFEHHEIADYKNNSLENIIILLEKYGFLCKVKHSFRWFKRKWHIIQVKRK